MIHIKYRLAPSPLHGIGVFAGQDIPKDFCIVEASPLLDINLSNHEFENLTPSEKAEVTHHGHFDKVTNKWHVDFDMTRFANHSLNPNLKQLYNEKGYYIVALEKITAGTELTINYSDFETNSDTRAFN